MKFKICFHCSQVVLLFSLLNDFCTSQTTVPYLSTNNEGTGLRNVSQKFLNENLIMVKMSTDISFVENDKSDLHVSNISYAVPPFALEEKKRLKRTFSESSSEMPPLFLLALEEVSKPGCKVKREISKSVIPLRLYAVGDGNIIRKRSIVNDSIVDKVIEKYFPKIKEQPPMKFKTKTKTRRKAHSSPMLRRNIRYFKEENYPLSSEPLNIDELNVITEANRTLDHISKLTECDSFEMPEAMKKPLVAVLMKRISNIYSDKNKIKRQ